MRHSFLFHLLLVAASLAPCFGADHVLSFQPAGRWPPLGGFAARSVEVHGNYAYLVTVGGVVIVDVLNPREPKAGPMLEGVNVAVNGDFAYVIDRDEGLKAYNITDPANPRIVWGRPLGISPNSQPSNVIDASGSWAVVGEIDGVSIFNLEIFPEASVVATLAMRQPLKIKIIGSKAYVSTLDGLHVIDLARAQPEITRTYAREELGYVQGIAAKEDRIFLATSRGLVVISDRIQTFEAGRSYLDVTISGDHLFAIGESYELQIFDIRTPEAPSSIYISGPGKGAWGVAVAGSYAYLADTAAVLRVLDVSEPAAPKAVLDWTGQTFDVLFEPPYAFVADGFDAGLRVLDLTEPARARQVAQMKDGIFRMARDGFHIFALTDDAKTGDKGLRIIDVSNALAPRSIGFFATEGRPFGIAVENNVGFLSADGVVKILDVSDRANPRLLQSYGSHMGAIEVHGSWLYAWRDQVGIEAIDVSDPSNPVMKKALLVGGRVAAMKVHGNTLYVTGSGLIALDVSDPVNLRALGPPLYAPVGGEHISISGNFAIVADGWQGFAVVDISNPERLRRAGSHRTDYGFGTASAAGGGLVALSYGERRLEIVRATELLAEHPVRFASNRISNFAAPLYVAASRSTAYASMENHELAVLDLTPASGPELVKTIPVFQAGHVAVSGNLICVAQRESGFTVFDVTNPRDPLFAGKVAMPQLPLESSSIADLQMSDQYALMAVNSPGLRPALMIVDLSDPANPRTVGEYQNDHGAKRLAVRGSTACLLTGRGVEVIDWSEPAMPVLLGTYEDYRPFETIAMGHNYVYINGHLGMEAIDLADPRHPVRSGMFFPESQVFPGEFVVRGGRAYVSNTGLQVIDVATMNWVGGYAEATMTSGLALYGDRAYVCGDSRILFTYDLNSLPRLEIVPQDGSLLLRWSESHLRFHLHHSAAVNGPWQRLQGGGFVLNGTVTRTVLMGTAPMFFQLRAE